LFNFFLFDPGQLFLHFLGTGQDARTKLHLLTEQGELLRKISNLLLIFLYLFLIFAPAYPVV